MSNEIKREIETFCPVVKTYLDYLVLYRYLGAVLFYKRTVRVKAESAYLGTPRSR